MNPRQADLSVHLYVVSMMERGSQSFARRFSHRSSRTKRPGQGFVLVIGLSPAHLSYDQRMQPLQIERQTDQAPLASDGLLAAQRELPEAQHLFDDADHRLDRACARAVDCFPKRSF